MSTTATLIPRLTVNHLDEVNALPSESVIRTDTGHTLEKLSDGWYQPAIAGEGLQPNHHWLPVIVLWDPSKEN